MDGRDETPLCRKYGCNDPTHARACERVSVCCGVPEHSTPAIIGRAEGYCGKCHAGTDFKCSVHNRPWPDEGECPASKEKVG